MVNGIQFFGYNIYIDYLKLLLYNYINKIKIFILYQQLIPIKKKKKKLLSKYKN